MQDQGNHLTTGLHSAPALQSLTDAPNLQSFAEEHWPPPAAPRVHLRDLRCAGVWHAHRPPLLL